MCGQRPPAGRPVSGPYEKTGEFPVFCRGGCPHPPALKCSDLPVGATPCGRPPSVDHNARRARPPGRAAHAIPQGRGMPLLRAGLGPAPTERPDRSPYFAGAGVLTRPPSVDHNVRRARPSGRAAHAIPQGRGVPLPRAGPRPARKPSPCKGEGAERSEADEGDFLKFAAASGSPKGLPCQVRESSLRTAGEGRTP